MEDLKTYLESGILEQYVLGDLSKEEMIAVEKNALRYPEIRTEISEIENALLGYAKSNSIEPSAAIRNRILNSLDSSDQDIQISKLKPSCASPKSSLNMPSNDQEHQYQLWAMVDGKPVDLGVFDSGTDSTGMKKMKSVKDTQAFAVTLEPRGGSVDPTMDQMMAIGSI